ncbi:MAG: TIGR03067 domain-containing protein [Planctomycetota bacterium]
MERQRLRGTWKVTSSKLRGKELTDAPRSEFLFTDAKVTLTEGAKQLQGEYKLDVTSEPRQLLVTFLGDQRGRSLSFSYSIEGELLTLCCDLRPGSAPPAELRTDAGDSRLLATLKRAKMKP